MLLALALALALVVAGVAACLTGGARGRGGVVVVVAHGRHGDMVCRTEVCCCSPTLSVFGMA